MILRTKADLHRAAGQFARGLRGGDIVLLEGELGSGKTAWVKAMARELGVREHVVSPTFTIMNVYTLHAKHHGASRLCHIDTYRLHKAEELQAVGAAEYLEDTETITAIEWPDLARPLFEGKTTKTVRIAHIADGREVWFS